MKKLYLLFAFLFALIGYQDAGAYLVYLNEEGVGGNANCYMTDNSLGTWSGKSMTRLGDKLYVVSGTNTPSGNCVMFYGNDQNRTTENQQMSFTSGGLYGYNENKGSYGWNIIVNGSSHAMAYNASSSNYTCSITCSGSTSIQLKDTKGWFVLSGNVSGTTISGIYQSDQQAYVSLNGTYTATFNPVARTLSFSGGGGGGGDDPENPGQLPTKKWKITATASNPQVFLIGEHLNYNRVTPEYEMKRGADGKYHIDPFMVVPGAKFKVRVFTSDTENGYKDYSYNNASANSSNINNAAYTWGTDTYTNNGDMTLNLGYSMVSMTFDNTGNHRLEVTLDTKSPSTLSCAPIKGHPYVSLQGQATRILDKYTTPNSGWGNGSARSTTDGWENGWAQMDEDGNVLIYDDNIDGGRYGGSAVSGRAMYNTIWPPRNPVSFYYKYGSGKVLETSSDDLHFKYLGTKKRSEANTNDTDANDDKTTYAVYEVTDIEMTGAYKIWSGWGGRPENVNGDNSGSYWSSHVNWGFNKWVSGQSTPINTEEWYGMNGAGFDIKDGGAFNYVDNSAGGDFNFDGTRLFSKVQLWYALDDNNPNKGRDDSWVITYLAVANPYISIRRSAKTEVTGDYEMRNLPTDGRTVKSYRIYLIKEGEDGADGAKTLVESKPDGSYDPATLKGTVVSDNLPSGRYKYRFEASYNQGGTVTYPDQAWETPWVRIYGMIQPVITRAEQVTVVEGNELDGKKTFYSFDIAVEAHAPSTTTDNGSELSDLIKSYKVTFPSITGYDFAASIEAKNSDGTEATTSVSGNTMTVTPDKGNNNAMPSLTFKNVIPGDHKFTVDMLAEDGDTEWPADNVTSASETVEMVVPSVKLDNMRASLNQVAADADMTHIALEERMNVRHGHVREHDTEGSSWEKEGKTGKQNNGGYGAHLSRYNRIDAYGDLSTLLVTDGVLTDWDVNIEVVLQDAGAGLDEKYHYTPDASSTINKTANELVISYLPVAMQDKPIADELTIYTDNATAKAQTYHAPAKTIVNYVVTTTYKRKTVTSDVVTATKDESTFTVYNPEKPNDSNVQFGAVTGSFDKPHGIQLEGHSWQKWYNAFNVLDLETGNANGNFAVGFFFTNGTELPVYEPTDPQHKIYPGGHVLDCSINRHNGYTERFYNVFTDAPSATKHFGEMAVDATGYGVDEHGGGGYKSLPLHLGCVYKFDNVTDKPLLKEDFSSFAKLEGVLITTHPIVVKPDGNGVRPTVSLMTSDSKTIPFVAAAKNAKAASRALLAIETPSHVEKGFDGATTDLDEVLGDFNTAFRVFPNPAVDIVTVEASAEIGNVEVVASNGATALKAEIRDTKGQLDVSALPAGLYLLRTDAGTTRLIVK